MYILIEIVISIIFSLIPLLFYIKNKKNLKYMLIASLIIFIGCLVRLLFIDKYPIGFNQDEASIGYEAYSILNYGIDRSGYSYPIHLNAWGSGQNALYAYILIPFIKILGLNIFSVRLPSAIISCITLIVSYFLFKNEFKDKKGLLYLLLLAIMPWHIMKSRWALESNIFPDLIYYSLILIYYGVKYNKKRYHILSSIILGISTYSYGTSYAFVPIFILLTYIYLIAKHKVKLKSACIYILITTLIALPMILFVIINYFNLNTIKIFNITIPKLDYTRFASSNIKENFIIYILKNLLRGFLTILYQADGSGLNTINVGGLFYRFSLPFIVIGFYKGLKSKNILINLNNILLISSIFIIILILPNINRINVIWLPLIIYLGYGILEITKHKIIYLKIILLTYILSFNIFTIYYFNNYQKHIGDYTFNGLLEAIEYSKKLEYKNLYITSSVHQPYIYYLFTYKTNPNYYIKTRNIIDKDAEFQYISNIDNINFYLNSYLEQDNVYILDNQELKMYNIDEFNTKTFNDYTIIYTK